MVSGAVSGGPKANLASVAIVVVAILLAVIGGMAASFGNVVIAAVLIGAIGGGILLARPWWMVTGVVLIVYVAHGLIQFFSGFGQLQWIASMLGVALIVLWAIQSMASRSTDSVGTLSPIVVAGSLFMLVMIFSSLVNGIPFMQGVVGFRTFVPFWGVFLFLAMRTRDLSIWKRILFALMAVTVMQWPVELYQKLFVVSARTAGGYGGSAFDSVVGTFGGAMFGGGESGSLAVFLVIMLMLFSALGKARFLPKWLQVFISLSAIVAMGLSETKAVFVLIPVGLLWLYRDYISRRPVAFLVGSTVAAVVLAGLLTAYYKLHWEEQSRRIDPVTLIQQRFLYSFDPTFMPAPDWPGRMTGLVIWRDHHDSVGDAFNMLFGHGASSSTSWSSLIGRGEATKRYGNGLDVTGGTKLLWEGGVLGLLSFLGIIGVAFVQSGRLSKDARIPREHGAAMAGVQAGFPLIALAVFYEGTAVSSPPMQLTFLLLLAYVDFWYRRAKGATG